MPRATWPWTPRVAAACAAAAAALPYLPVLGNGLLNFEDYYLILDNAPLRSLGPDSLRWMLTSVSHGTYQPLGWLLYAALLGVGAGPAAFHLVALLLHAAAAVAALLVTRELLRRAGHADDGRLLGCALGGTLLWAVHPLQVESVAWATELPDQLAVLLAACSVGAYLARERPGARRGAWLSASVALFALSLLARWRACALPVLLVVLDAYPLRRRAWGEKVLYAVPAAAAVLANYRAKSELLSGAARFHPGAARAPLFYLWKLAAFRPLRIWYSMDDPASLPLPAWACAALLIAVSVALWRARRRAPGLAAAWAFYLASIAPVAVSFSPNLPLAASNHYAYFSWLWVPPLAAAGLLSATRRAAAGRAVVVAAAAVWLAVAGASSWTEAAQWRDSTTFWRHVLAAGGAPFYARPNFALALLDEGRPDEAAAALEEQLRLFPGDAASERLLSRVRAGRPGRP